MQCTSQKGDIRVIKKKIIIISSVAAGLLLLAALIFVIIIRPGPMAADENETDDAGITQTAPTTPGLPTGDGFTIAPTALGDITITPISITPLGVATDSGFLVSSDVQTLTEGHLRAHLSVRSGENFVLEEQPNGAFLLSFEENLENNRVYNLVYSPPGRQAASHAFQTADIFRITATTPAGNTHGIPHYTGIEITFNQELAGGFEAAFAIDPPAEGRFYQRDNTYIFAPHSLEFNTAYTVTISRDLMSTTGEMLAEDYVFSFTTQWGTATAPLFSISGSAYETFLPWNEVFIALNVSRDFRGRDFDVRLYDLQTPENFINFTGTASGQLVDTFEIELREFETEHQSFFYLFLEQALPAGYYVAEIRSTEPNTDIVLHKFIQVSALSVYSLSIDGESVFWVHDAATGQPTAGAQIRIDGTTVITNSDGITLADVGQNTHAVITIEYGNHPAFAYAKPTFARRNLLPNDRFLTYMYTDRPSYRPNDTIDVFGVIMPRYGHAHLPGDVFTLRIGNIVELPIILDTHNSFAMRVPVTNMFGHMDIEVWVNDQRLMSSWVRFLDYTNLSFIIEGELDRVAYFVGEYAAAEISVTTFAGFPVEGITMSSGHGDSSMSLFTDDMGIAAGSIPVRDGWGSMPQWSSFWFSVASDAQMSQSINLPKIVVPVDVMMEHEYTGGDTAVITTNRILIDQINQHASIDPDVFRGPAVDVDFTVEITRHVTTRTVRHQTYDHINRRTVTTYDFATTNYNYDTITGRTENGTATITDLPVPTDPLISYSISITYQDTAGRGATVQLWDRSWRNFRQESSIRHFFLDMEQRSFGINETFNVSVTEGHDPWNAWWHMDEEDRTPPITQGRLLAILARDGIISATAGNPQGTPVTFTEAAISSAWLFGAYFDGRYIFPISHPATVQFDPAERELEIELSFDQETYQPGDDVTVTIQTSAAAQVVISVVDESSILSGWHQPNFLSRLYGSSWHSWSSFHQFASHTQHNFGGAGSGAEGGGGDGDGFDGIFRDRFVDNPVFEIVQTDSNGRATLTFTLADQVTSWRVTAIGLTEDGFAGDAVYNIITPLPFYVDLMLTNEYIVGDDIAAVARVFGSGAAPVSFTFSILKDDEIIYTAAQTSARSAMFNAGKLDAGQYVMRVAAVFGNYSDAMELPFTVAQSGMILPIHVAGRLYDDGVLDGFNMRSLPVQITLTNANMRPLANILHGMRNSRSHRTDYMAANIFIDYFFTGVADFGAVRGRVQSQQWGDAGGIPQLTYENADFFYTARFAASFPEFVDAGRLRGYIRRETIDAYARKRAAGLLALAAIGEHVLLEIHSATIGPGSSDRLTMLYLAAALVAIGDYAGAFALIEGFDDSFLHNVTTTEKETANTLMLFINSAINPQAAWAHINRGYANEYVSDVPERINFFRRAYIRGETVSQVQYYLNGTTHTVRLENFDVLSLQLSQEQFDTLSLVPISGETDFHIDFYGYNAANWDTDGNRIEMQRTIVRDGDLFRVDFQVNLPVGVNGLHTIYDRVPSNMRFVSLPAHQRMDWNNHFVARHTQRQLVELSFFSRPGQARTRTLSYHVMELFEADMATGTTYISNNCTQSHVWGTTR